MQTDLPQRVPGAALAQAPVAGDGQVRHVPPNSDAFHECMHAIEAALTMPSPATEKDELTYLRIGRDRQRAVRQLSRTLGRDREVDEQDVMLQVHLLHGLVAGMPADQYEPNPLEF